VEFFKVSGERYTFLYNLSEKISYTEFKPTSGSDERTTHVLNVFGRQLSKLQKAQKSIKHRVNP